MSVVQEFNLNIIPDSGPVVVHVDQYDHGEGRLVAHLYNGSTPYSPVGASAMIQGTKPDGNFYMYSCDIDGNTVTANLEEIMTQVCGRVRTQFVITDSEDRTGTFVFELDVQSSALNGAGGSESIIEYIQEAIEETQEKALESEAWAVGQRGGTDVPSTDPAYHNNSKYYSEQADTSATNAANSESAASGSAEDSEAWAVGERGGVPVTYGDPTYHNNAEYWADVARQSAGASVVANTETETSAHAYAVGDQFIYNGVLYTATAPISIGGTITPGTNCTASDNIVDQLENKADLVGGKVPAAQLPSYVDDVIEGYYYNSKFYEEAAHTTEITPETGKIYVDLSTDVTYRWSGSAYIALSNPDIANDAVTAITASTAEYPVPAVNELLKVIIGKINKFLDDLKTKKADKVSSATNGDFAGLDANGNLTDSGKKAGDFLTSHQTIKQDGVTGATVNRFGTCSTAAGTAAKTVSITTGTFALVEGARVTVKFSNANTADTPMLNVNSTGAHYIYYRGVQVKSGGAPINVLSGTIDFVYDGSNYNIVGTFANAIPSTDTSEKIFLLGATSQSASNADSYTQDTAYVGTDGCLYSDSKKVFTAYYKEGSTTVSTANQAFTVAISDSNISTSSKILSVCTSVKGLNYTDITLASGSCTISFPGVSSAQTVTVGIEWR